MKALLPLAAALSLLPLAARAEVSVPTLFGDGCVLQRSESVPIYGKAADGEKVTRSFQEQCGNRPGAIVDDAPTKAAELSRRPKGFGGVLSIVVNAPPSAVNDS